MPGKRLICYQHYRSAPSRSDALKTISLITRGQASASIQIFTYLQVRRAVLENIYGAFSQGN
jgi:hypothetical protein